MTVPEVKLIVLADQAITPIDTARSRTHPPQTTPADLRWMRVEEFMRSREISSNTRKAYERDLKQFMDWTDKGWHEITARDLDRYKNHLKVEPNHRDQLRKNATGLSSYLLGKFNPKRLRSAPLPKHLVPLRSQNWKGLLLGCCELR